MAFEPGLQLASRALCSEDREAETMASGGEVHLAQGQLHKSRADRHQRTHASAESLSASRKLFLIRNAKVSGIEITTLSMKMMLVFNPSARFPAWELTASLQESQVKPVGAARLSTASMSPPLSKTPLQLCVEFTMPRFYARLGLSG